MIIQNREFFRNAARALRSPLGDVEQMDAFTRFLPTSPVNSANMPLYVRQSYGDLETNLTIDNEYLTVHLNSDVSVAAASTETIDTITIPSTNIIYFHGATAETFVSAAAAQVIWLSTSNAAASPHADSGCLCIFQAVSNAAGNQNFHKVFLPVPIRLNPGTTYYVRCQNLAGAVAADVRTCCYLENRPQKNI